MPKGNAANSILYMIGSGVIGIAMTMMGFFIKSYFTSRDKKDDQGDTERRKIFKTLNEIKIQLTQMQGEINTAHAAGSGKIGELNTKLKAYTEAYESKNKELTEKVDGCTKETKKLSELVAELKVKVDRLTKESTEPGMVPAN